MHSNQQSPLTQRIRDALDRSATPPAAPPPPPPLEVEVVPEPVVGEFDTDDNDEETDDMPVINQEWRNTSWSGYIRYEVGTEGGFRRLKYGDDWRYLATNPAPDGHVRVHISTSRGKARSVRFDALMLETFVGVAPSDDHGPHHLNGDRTDNRLANLEWRLGSPLRKFSAHGKRRKSSAPIASPVVDTTIVTPSIANTAAPTPVAAPVGAESVSGQICRIELRTGGALTLIHTGDPFALAGNKADRDFVFGAIDALQAYRDA